MTTKKMDESVVKYSCNICDYNTSRTYNMKTHMMTSSHLNKCNINEKNGENKQSFICDICDFSTMYKSNMDKHLLTSKHINKYNDNEKNGKHKQTSKYLYVIIVIKNIKTAQDCGDIRKNANPKYLNLNLNLNLSDLPHKCFMNC